MLNTVKGLLADCTYKKQEIDRFFDDSAKNWATFDSELGYTLKNSIMKDGVDSCYTIANYNSKGERKVINYADKTCRINTYGNSFTQGHQVSDGETWQEYLAAHIGEPIKNFGIGGYGVYQAYRRMIRVEETDAGAEYLILNIWSDDHYRNIDKWRWIRIDNFREDFRKKDSDMFHANPWSFIRLNSETAEFEEFHGLFQTKKDLYKLCNEEFVYKTFKDDLIVNLELAKRGGEFKHRVVIEAAELLGVPFDFSTLEDTKQTAEKIHTTYALRSSMYIVDKARSYSINKRKKLMVVLSYSAPDVYHICEKNERFDDIFVKYLTDNNIPYVDTLKKHQDDFSHFKFTPAEYLKYYYIYGVGHYKPVGNHFFAFAIKDDIINWLSPKPITYLDENDSCAIMSSYLA